MYNSQRVICLKDINSDKLLSDEKFISQHEKKNLHQVTAILHTHASVKKPFYRFSSVSLSFLGQNIGFCMTSSKLLMKIYMHIDACIHLLIIQSDKLCYRVLKKHSHYQLLKAAKLFFPSILGQMFSFFFVVRVVCSAFLAIRVYKLLIRHNLVNSLKRPRVMRSGLRYFAQMWLSWN